MYYLVFLVLYYPMPILNLNVRQLIKQMKRMH